MSRLFVSDLDGTLIQDDERLSDFARAELARLLADGLLFTVASARSIASMRPILDGLPFTLPVIEFNGTMTTGLDTGRRRFCHTIDSCIARAVARAGARLGTEPFVSTGGPHADDDALFAPAIRNDGMEAYFASRAGACDPRLRPEATVQEGLEKPVVCLTFINRPERLAPLVTLLQSDYPGAFHSNFFENWYCRGWWWLTLHPALGTKAHAVEQLAASLAVDMADVTVFGDQVNDIPMFEVAGRAVAVENAVDDLKAHADLVIGPNTDDSVVRYLADLTRTHCA